MTCRCALELIEDYVDGELPEVTVKAVAGHLDGCRSCRQRFLEARQLKQLMRRMPGYDPGQEYWLQTEQLIRARTVEVHPCLSQPSETTVADVGDGRRALMRALVSLAASLSILVSAILIGVGQEPELSAGRQAAMPILATAPVSELLAADHGPVVTHQEQMRLARGMLLMGPPGFLGRFYGLPDLMMATEK